MCCHSILLEGTISNNYCGDAAIDDLSVSENRCTSFKRLHKHRRRELPATPAPEGSPSVSTAPVLPPPEVLETLFCDFEKGLCGWSQCTSDDFDWELHQERLPPLLSATQPDSQGKCRNFEALGLVKINKAVEFYNAMKYGVDILDQMARLYSVKGGTRRWPVAVFYVLDLAAINVLVLYKECTSNTITRRGFILQLALELRQKHFDKRQESPLANAPQPSATAARTGTRNKRQCQVAKCNKNRPFDVCARCEKASLWQMHWYS
ncbi:UNVERIFIED_CONTAM: hypothetical protein FKN15_004505 [Acipenser sinensis]